MYGKSKLLMATIYHFLSQKKTFALAISRVRISKRSRYVHKFLKHAKSLTLYYNSNICIPQRLKLCHFLTILILNHCNAMQKQFSCTLLITFRTFSVIMPCLSLMSMLSPPEINERVKVATVIIIISSSRHLDVFLRLSLIFNRQP